MKKNISTLAALLASVMISQAQNANQNLSNLVAPVAVNKDLLPATNGAYNLGEPPRAWKNLSLTGILYLKNESFLKIAGTGGTFIGTNAGDATTGSFNSGFGFMSLRNNTTGYINTGTGYKTLYANTSGFANTANGYLSLYSNTGGYENTAVGETTLYSNTSGSFNSAFGNKALFGNTVGTGNTAAGYYSLKQNITGSDNSAFGYHALEAHTNGYGNIAFGGWALWEKLAGSYNTATGYYSNYRNISGSENTAYGYQSSADDAGSGNTAVGAISGSSVGRADENPMGPISIGIGDSRHNYCTFLGYFATAGGFVSGREKYNSTAIGYRSHVTADNQVVIGNSAVTSIGGYVNWTNFSDGRYKKNIKENVPGLAFIKELRAVTYTLDIQEPNTSAGVSANQENSKIDRTKEFQLASKVLSEKNKIIYTGFVAQEVEAAAKKLNYDFSGVKKPANNGDYYGLRYAEFVVPLVKAVQELSTENETLKTTNEKLEARLAAIEQLLKNNNLGTVSLDKNTLGQNIPNPANGRMTIPFSLSTETQHASIVITELGSGKILKTIPVTAAQKSVSVELGNIASGTYVYSLVINNRTSDSKKMVIAK